MLHISFPVGKIQYPLELDIGFYIQFLITFIPIYLFVVDIYIIKSLEIVYQIVIPVPEQVQIRNKLFFIGW